jgi:hypothetical protein
MKPRLKDSSALSDQNAPCGHILPAEALDAEALADAIAPVTRTASSLFVRHGAASITLTRNDFMTYKTSLYEWQIAGKFGRRDAGLGSVLTIVRVIDLC